MKNKKKAALYILKNHIKPVTAQFIKISKCYRMKNEKGKTFWTSPNTGMQEALLDFIKKGKVKLVPDCEKEGMEILSEVW